MHHAIHAASLAHVLGMACLYAHGDETSTTKGDIEGFPLHGGRDPSPRAGEGHREHRGAAMARRKLNDPQFAAFRLAPFL
ncbi:hypothetical protein KKP04_05365 [Rhodomicrobium sp. Az07]|uniref:hypothetical protein n=1 Tax=Rhodomicrobium sp. Az07 TaxID=2839034 RepID=UPI001BEAFE16|nr:hypothetical protein [Rhodomicrobium sp. Az07]MBT3070294.1 hypothetical protein [Rhodomicrobium sp. Az07]